MVSALFQPEVDTLQLHIAQLRNQVAQAEARVKALGECEVEADGLLQIAQRTIGKISALAPDAITTIKTALLGLFGNDGNQGHGGQPVIPDGPSPQPMPPADTNAKQHDVRQVVVYSWPEPEQLVLQPEPELLGQHSVLCCQLDDAPLQGQHCELMCPLKQNVVVVYEDSIKQSPTMVEEGVSVAPNESVFELVKVGNEVSYMKRSDTGEILCCYLGGSNKQTLRAWGEWLCINHSVGSKFEVRTSQRLTQFKHEAKVWGMSLTQIQKLAESDTSKRPPSNHPPAPKRLPERVPSDLEIADYQPGDVVRSVTVRNWHYKVIEVRQDGLIDCQRINVDAIIKATLSPASIELVARAAVVESVDRLTGESEEQAAINSIQPLLHPPAIIDENDIPDGVRLLHGRDDLLTQFEVLMTVEARVMGRIQRQQKQIGLLTEVSGGVEAISPRASIGQVFGRTLDAVAYLIAGSGYKPLHSVKEPVLIGAVSVDDDDF